MGFDLVSNTTLLNPMSRTPPLILQGPLEMIYISRTYVNPIFDHVPSEFITNPACSSFSIYISHSCRQLFDGLLEGRLWILLLL
jgi:hypothetical protein